MARVELQENGEVPAELRVSPVIPRQGRPGIAGAHLVLHGGGERELQSGERIRAPEGVRGCEDRGEAWLRVVVIRNPRKRLLRTDHVKEAARLRVRCEQHQRDQELGAPHGSPAASKT